jgi:RNA polymerase sigma-70 factor (ECF subfamily)
MDALRLRFEGEAVPHLRAVYNFALRLTLQDADARDLSQETFLRAFQSFDSFAAGTNCKAWLFTIAYSIFVNRYRKQRRESRVIAPADTASDVRSSAGSSPPVMTPARAAVEADVETALAELSDEFRAVIMLVDVEECSYEEAASALDCPIGTIRSRLFRARKHLAARLRGYDGVGRSTL